MSAVEAPARLEAQAPPEVRGAGRDDVAMMVAHRGTGAIAHARFDDLARHLDPGDLLVVNTSATLPAALAARVHGQPVELHLSTSVGDGAWIVELRTRDRRPLRRPPTGTRIELPAGGRAELLAPHASGHRLALARLELPEPALAYLARHGQPIRYGYVPAAWPIEAYQTVFAVEPGSAEMPSAGRPFTDRIVTELVSRGVVIAPIVLHTGVSSPERGEGPSPERFRVPATTALLVNAVHGWGGRVVAVGTTVVRALESVAAADGTVAGGDGFTTLLVTPERGLRTVDGLITGWHEPESSHLLMLEAAAGRPMLDRCYRSAAERGYLWHEFGDLHLILP